MKILIKIDYEKILDLYEGKYDLKELIRRLFIYKSPLLSNHLPLQGKTNR